MQPDAQELFGCTLPDRLPDRHWHGARKLCGDVCSTWHAGGLQLLRADAQFSLWLSDVLADLLQPDQHQGELQRLLECARLHLASGISASGWAEKLGISRDTLNRRLADYSMGTASDVLDSLRLEQVDKLLRTEKMPLRRVARFVGMNSVEAFSRWFKKMTGVAPSKWHG